MPEIALAVALAEATDLLKLSGLPDAPLEARVLLQHVLGRPREWIFTHPDHPLDEGTLARYRGLIDARLSGEPLAYLVGEREFYGRSFALDRRVLIPRPETELLVEAAAAFARRWGLRAPCIVDVGTGSGIIAVTLALELPMARLVAIDLSPDAIAVARANARRQGVEDRITFVVGDLLAPLDARFDLIVANLPYVPGPEVDRAPIEMRREPRLALEGGQTGLEVYERFFQEAPAHLSPRGGLFAEIGWDQGTEATRLARTAFPARLVEILPDWEGRDRVVAVVGGD